MFEVRPDILDVSKALGEDTRFSIFAEIAESETPLTVKDLVAIFGMHHSAIRIHLNRLEEAGLIISEKRHQKGAVGRPQLAYLPNPDLVQITLPPRHYQFLAALALDLATKDGVDLLAIEEFGKDWGRRFMNSRQNGRRATLPPEQAMSAVVEELRALGGSTEWSDLNGGGYALTQGNCPFAELSAQYECLVCTLHQAVARGMLLEASGIDFVLLQDTSMRLGDRNCFLRVVPHEAVTTSDALEAWAKENVPSVESADTLSSA